MHSKKTSRKSSGSSSRGTTAEPRTASKHFTDASPSWHIAFSEVVDGRTQSEPTPSRPAPTCLLVPRTLVAKLGRSNTSAKVFSLSFSAGRCEHGVVIRSIKHNVLSLTSQAKLPLCGGSERVPLLSEVLHWILSRVTANQTEDGAMQSKTLVNGHHVRIAVTGVHHTARRASRNIQYRMGRHVHGGYVDRLKYDRCHALSVSLGVQKSFREQNGMLSRRSTKFVVECVMPDSLQFVPIREETVPNQRSRQTRRSDARYLYTAPGRR